MAHEQEHEILTGQKNATPLYTTAAAAVVGSVVGFAWWNYTTPEVWGLGLAFSAMLLVFAGVALNMARSASYLLTDRALYTVRRGARRELVAVADVRRVEIGDGYGPSSRTIAVTATNGDFIVIGPLRGAPEWAKQLRAAAGLSRVP